MASPQDEPKPIFYNYPDPVPGPDVPYEKQTLSNPVLRGLPLTIGATALAYSTTLQDFFWYNANFRSLRNIKILDTYYARYDPCVIPVEQNASPSGVDAEQLFKDLPLPRIQPDDLSGRYHSIADFHELYKTGQVTPTAVVETLLPLIRRDISPIGDHSVAFLQSRVDLVLAAAAASTERYKNKAPLSVLDGVPVAVKDEVDVTGYKRTLGSTMDFTDPKDGTSWCVKKWEEAGAVMIGKTTMHEMGLDTTNNNPNFGTPRNPHHAGYYCGGSSGGSGYAVGSGLVPITLGADGGGSIRIPSTYCGVYGLKPSHGRVSGAPTVGIAGTTGVLGPIAATMADLEVAYRIMATPDPSSSSSSRFPIPRPLPSPSTRKKILGIYPAWTSQATPAIQDLNTAAIQYLVSTHNYTVVEFTVPLLPQGQLAHALTILAEISSFLHSSTATLTNPNKILVAVGSRTPAADFLQAQKLRHLLMQHLSSIFQRHPGLVLITPTTPNEGWPIAGGVSDLTSGVSDGNLSIRSMEYVWLANFTGVPSLSVPLGYVEPDPSVAKMCADGKVGRVPVGLMGMCEWGGEETLIEWGKEGEAWLRDEVEGGRRRPANWMDVLKMAKGRMRARAE